MTLKDAAIGKTVTVLKLNGEGASGAELWTWA